MLQLAGFLLIALCAAAQARPEAQVDVHDVIPGIGEYYFNGVPANWSTAFRQCQFSGGHLTVINTVAEKEALQEMMTRHGADSILVGFHDQFVEGVYSFITGKSLAISDSLWAPLYPFGGASSNCGNLNSAGIFDDSCSRLSPFICELSEDQGGEDTSDGFALLDGYGFFKFHKELLPWPQAWEVCRNERSELLVLDSEAELDALWNTYEEFDSYLWLGVHRQWGPDDGFVSVTNTPLSQLGYQKWQYETEPEGTFESDPYIMLTGVKGMSTSSIQWNYSFFCKRPLQ